MSRRILLADDSLTIQKVVELTFAETEYEVVAVSSGDELLRRLPGSSADLVICDVIMPGRDGYEVCQEIKSNPDLLHLPVILLTGTFEPFDRDRALAAGCSEIVTKPFEAKKLVDAVERLVAAAADGESGRGSFDEEPFARGQVTPPQPIMAPEELGEYESFADLDDTAATAPELPSEPAPAAGDEALDFSTSGFLEMEDAAREHRKEKLESPSEGLEFELEPDAADLAVDASDPFLDSSSRTAGFGTGAARVAPAEPFATSPDDNELDALDDPFADSVPIGADDGEPFPEPAEDERRTGTEEPVADAETGLTTPINVAAVMGARRPTASDRPKVESDMVDAAGNADTQDLAAPPTPAPAPAAVAAPAELRLSDEDVDRIARRVVELSGHLLEHIAWEVIPDMAEIVVRERVREIEAAAEIERP